MWQRRRIHLKSDAGDAAQGFAVPQDLLCHLAWTTDEHRAVGAQLSVERTPGHGTPAALLRNVLHRACEAGIEIVCSLLLARCDVAGRVQADLEPLERVPSFLAGLPVHVDERTEAPCLSADNRDHQRKAQPACS